MLIKYTKASLYRCNEMRLIPGVNEVSDKVWDSVKDNPLVKARLSNGEIVLMKVSTQAPQDSKASQAGAPAAYSLAELNANEAKEIVKETLDLKLLEAWKEKETRKAVVTAIEKQIESLAKPEKEDKESE